MREGIRLTKASSIVKLQAAIAIDPKIYRRQNIRIMINKTAIGVRKCLPYQHNIGHLMSPLSNVLMAVAHLKALFSHFGTLNTNLDFQL